MKELRGKALVEPDSLQIEFDSGKMVYEETISMEDKQEARTLKENTESVVREQMEAGSNGSLTSVDVTSELRELDSDIYEVWYRIEVESLDEDIRSAGLGCIMSELYLQALALNEDLAEQIVQDLNSLQDVMSSSQHIRYHLEKENHFRALVLSVFARAKGLFPWRIVRV